MAAIEARDPMHRAGRVRAILACASPLRHNARFVEVRSNR
jgi:hypothetical protein